jgi:hypothetical protein
VRIVFSTEKFAKNFISGLKMEKKFGKEEKVSKNPFQWECLVGFTKSNSSEQNIGRNHRLKINFQRYVVVQAKTKHERSRQTQ